MKSWKASLLLTMACGLAALPAAAQGIDGQVPVREFVEPASGATIRLYRAPAGEVAFDVSHGGVVIAKHIASTGSTTIVRTPDDRVVLRVAPSRLVLEDRRGVTTFEDRSRSASDAVRRRMAGSEAVRRGLTLLNELRFTSASPLAAVLLATRSLLADLSGLPVTAHVSARLFDRPAARSTLVRIVDGPGECWDEYAKEAIQIYKEFEQCMADVKWWDVFSRSDCESIYEIQAIGAFSWWMACVSLDSWKS